MGFLLFNGVAHTTPLFMVIPFATLLLAIAILPYLAKGWWEKYSHIVVAVLAFVVSGYYLFHGSFYQVQHAILDYAGFITLIGPLFVISSGIFIRVRGTGTPLENTFVLLTGAVLANFFGTTGASMLLIRPFLKMNRERIKKYHVVFFIFIVANTGGLLTPMGDPPLWIGFIFGVPFFVPLNIFWPVWMAVNVILLTVFFIIDSYSFYKEKKSLQRKAEARDQWSFVGLPNLVFLGMIIGCMFLPRPFREVGMIISALLSYRSSSVGHRLNEFSFEPLKEVATLFIGIFVTMIPAIEILQARDMGLTNPIEYFFVTGALSSVLDNAPTYVALLAQAMGREGLSMGNPADVLLFTEQHPELLIAISAGAVLFGAMTYIGNAPNMLIKEIAEKTKIPVPTFFGYIGFAFLILMPILVLIGLAFLR